MANFILTSNSDHSHLYPSSHFLHIQVCSIAITDKGWRDYLNLNSIVWNWKLEITDWKTTSWQCLLLLSKRKHRSSTLFRRTTTKFTFITNGQLYSTSSCEHWHFHPL